MKSIAKLLISLILLMSTYQLMAQVPTVADCLGAIPVCDDIYFEANSYEGEGNYTNEIHPDNCNEEEVNSVWYRFNPKKSGNLGFEIIPNDPDDDYDWAVFNITNIKCEDLSTNFGALVSCNATGGDKNGESCYGITGANGGTIYNFQNKNCGIFPPTMDSDGYLPFNDFIPVIAGETYVLLLLNWTGSENGYTLDFTKGENVEISDNIRPEVQNYNISNSTNIDCAISEMNIQLSEYIFCSSLNSADISISGPGGPYSFQIESADCINGIYSNQFNIIFSPPITDAGTFTFSINEDPIDLCYNPLLKFETEIINQFDNQEIDVLDTFLCNKKSITLDASDPNALSYNWQDNSNAPTLTVYATGDYSAVIQTECITITKNFRVEFRRAPEILDFITTPASCNSFGEINFIDFNAEGNLQYSIDGINYSNQEIVDNLPAGEYLIYIKDDTECVNEYIFTVDETPALVSLDLQSEITISYGDSVYLEPLITGMIDSFYWSGDLVYLSCPDCINTFAAPLKTSSYSFTIIDSNGCEVVSTILIRVKNQYDFFAPNIFSPNQDGINDYFTIYGNNQMESILSLRVYNRWGELIFSGINLSKNEPNQGWNGSFKNRQVNSGVYTWTAELLFVDGNIVTRHGTITVVK